MKDVSINSNKNEIKHKGKLRKIFHWECWKIFSRLYLLFRVSSHMFERNKSWVSQSWRVNLRLWIMRFKNTSNVSRLDFQLFSSELKITRYKQKKRGKHLRSDKFNNNNKLLRTCSQLVFARASVRRGFYCSSSLI